MIQYMLNTLSLCTGKIRSTYNFTYLPFRLEFKRLRKLLISVLKRRINFPRLLGIRNELCYYINQFKWKRGICMEEEQEIILPEIGSVVEIDNRKAKVISLLNNTIVAEWEEYSEDEEKRIVVRHEEYKML